MPTVFLAIVLSLVTSATAITVALINTKASARSKPVVNSRLVYLEEERDGLVGQVAELEIRCSRAEDMARDAQREVQACRDRESGLWTQIRLLQSEIQSLRTKPT